ncbi:MAG: DUF6261 family protein, partial [Tannerellaceae bacterium]|nr:DUF6261 family protein [Tannerellaceae bacterium]
MKIEILKLTNLRNDEHFEFFTEFIKQVNNAGAAPLKITKPFDALTLLFAEEDEALKKILKSGLTGLIHEADEARDTVFRGLSEANLAALNHFRADVHDAAVRLQIIFDTYGNVARKSVDEETSAVQNLLEELTQRHAADMQKVGLGEWAEELQRLNEEVRKLTMSRDDETTTRPSLVLRQVRGKVDGAYRKIVTRIDAFAVIEEMNSEESDDDDYGAIPPGELKLKLSARTSESPKGGVES